MSTITQEAHKRQVVVKLAKRKWQTYASKVYGISLSRVKRWCKLYDGIWQSLKEPPHRPHNYPRQHTEWAEIFIVRAGIRHTSAMDEKALI